MFQNASRRAISLAFLLAASITFQSFAFMPGGVVMAQKQKPLRLPTRKPTAGVSLNPPSASITATKVDAWDDTATPDGKAEPGQTVTYTVQITNTGGVAATGVTFTDNVDTNTTLVPGSVATQPIASPDSYNVIGNVRIQPNAAAGLLANDTDPDTGNNTGLTASGPATTTQGGNLTINADGSFSYNPPVGFGGTDTFTYTITDPTSKTDTAIATLKVGNGTATPGTNVVWFVDPAAGAGGDGRLTSPFNCYTGGSASCFSQTAADDPGDTIFLYSGAHTGGYTLLSTQKLIGQGASASLATISALTVQTYSDPLPTTGGASPTMTTTNVTAVPLGLDNTVRGFTIGNVGTGIKISGVSFGTLTVGDSTTPDMTLNGTGQALNLSTGTLAATSAFASVTSTSSSGAGINLAGLSGTLAMGSTTISGSATQGILVGTTTAAINFGNTSVSGGSDGVSFQNNSSGTRTFGTLSISNNSGIGFLHSAGGGNVSVTGTTLIPAAAQTAPAGTGIDINNLAVSTSVVFADVTVNKGNAGTGVSLGTIANPNLGNVSFNSLGITTSNGTALLSAANTGTTGSITVSTSAGNISATSGPAINITKTVAPATPITLNFGTVASTNSGTTGITIDRVSGNLTSGTTTTTNPTGIGISVLNTSAGGTMNFGNTTSNTSAGTGVSLGTNAGAVSFNALNIAPDAGVAGFSVASSTGNTSCSSGTILTSDAAAVTVNSSGVNMTLTSVSTDNTGDADNCVNLTSASGTINMQAGALVGGTSAAFLVSAGNPTATYAGTVTQNSAARVVDIQGTTGNTVSFTDTGTAVTGGASSLGVHIGDTSAVNGNVSFAELNLGTSGSRMSNQAVTITNGGSAATYTLGVVSIFTNNVTGIGATNFDGTLNSTSGTVDCNQGTSVNIDGPAGLTTLGMILTKVVSDGGSATGLNIQETAGSFSVAGSGGTCNTAAACTGGSLSNKAAGSPGTDGVRIQNATNISLTRIFVKDNGGNGVFASTTNGIKIDNCWIESNADNTTGGFDPIGGFGNESNIHYMNVTGSALAGSNPTSITNSTVINAFEHDIEVDQTSGALADLQINSSTISNNGASTQAGTRILYIQNGAGASGTMTVQDCTMVGNRTAGALTAAGIQATTSAGTQNIKVFRNLFQNHNVAIDVSTATSGILNFDITDNGGSGGTANNGASNGKITGSDSIAVNVFTNANSTGSVNGFIRGNTIGTQGSAGSGSVLGRGIQFQNEGSVNSKVLISGNIVQGVSGNQEINVQHGIAVAGAAGTSNVTVINNTLRENTGSSSRPLNSEILNSGTLCVDISGNAFGAGLTGQGGGSSLLRVNEGATGAPTMNVRQAQPTAAASASELDDANGLSFAGGQVTVAGSPNFAAGTCTQPTVFGPAFEIGRTVDLRNVVMTASAKDESADAARTVISTPISTSRLETVPVRLTQSGLVIQEAKQTESSESSLARARVDAVRPQANEVKLNHAATANAKSSTVTTAAVVHPAPLTPGGGGTVNVTIGTLAAGDSVTITFQVVVDNPYSGGPNVSNQGSVSGNNPSAFTNLTDDPSVGGTTDPTLTPINSSNIGINDAKQAEPSTGTIDMVFTVSLSSPATGAVGVNFTTADNTATAGTCGNPGADYVLTSGTVNFTAGQQVKTINVPICSDAVAEANETFFVNLSGATGGTLVDNQGIGTITANTAGTFLISELRTSGPAGPGDDFVELYNNTNSPLTVAASDASTGYGLFKMGADCNATPVLIGIIPNSTVIPARGHYLVVGSQYSLANYGGAGAAAGNLTMTSDIETDRNVAVFSTANIVNISSANRLDAVGFGTNTGVVCDLLREPSNLGAVAASPTIEHSFFRKECDFVGGCQAGGNPKDSNDNLADFLFADTQGTFISGIAQHLGAPGPENMASPIRRDNSGISALLLDGAVASSAHPNRTRSFTGVTNGTFGTLTVRRRVVNSTGGNVTRLRYRIVELTTFPSPGGGAADLRVLTSTDEAAVGPINDAATCTASGAGSPPCTVTVRGTTLESPPAQPNGGGYNSTVSSGTITLGTPLANGASINVRFLLGIQQTGTFRFYIIVEALP